jgi:adenosylhomocysteine nucleosidase
VGADALSQPAEQEVGLNHLGIIVGVPAEARSLANFPITNDEPVRLREGVTLGVSGVGPRRAGLASRRILEKGVTALLSWGSAGGLSPKLSAGNLILPKMIISSDRSIYPADPSWHRDLCDRLEGQVEFHTGPLAESAVVVRTPEEKAILFRQTGAIGVDMESAAVAAAAQEARVPFMAVRVVADSSGITLPESALNACDAFGRLNFLKLIRGIAARPTELFSLIRLGRDYRAAQRTLTLVARLVGRDLLFFREGPGGQR